MSTRPRTRRERLAKAAGALVAHWLDGTRGLRGALANWPRANAKRDITALHTFAVEQALTIDEPSVPPIDNDLVDSVADTYGAADRDDVVEALETHADRLAELADSQHHLDDVERGLADP